jgi:hypothetical protein
VKWDRLSANHSAKTAKHNPCFLGISRMPPMPVVGFLRTMLTDVPNYVNAFRQGLKEAGFSRARTSSGYLRL